jgi:hypothetical protein
MRVGHGVDVHGALYRSRAAVEIGADAEGVPTGESGDGLRESPEAVARRHRQRNVRARWRRAKR